MSCSKFNKNSYSQADQRSFNYLPNLPSLVIKLLPKYIRKTNSSLHSDFYLPLPAPHSLYNLSRQVKLMLLSVQQFESLLPEADHPESPSSIKTLWDNLCAYLTIYRNCGALRFARTICCTLQYLQVNALSEWIIGIFLHEFTNNEREISMV